MLDDPAPRGAIEQASHMLKMVMNPNKVLP